MEVRLEHETVWLTQEQMANLFGTKRPAITKHLNNIYNSGELDKRTTCSILEHVGKEYLLKGYAINQRLSELEQTVTEHSKKIDFFVKASLPPIEGVFYNGQIFDAYKLVADIIKSAKKSILLIDNYVDESVLLMLAKRGLNVSATIYTSKVSSQLQLDFDRHNAQ